MNIGEPGFEGQHNTVSETESLLLELLGRELEAAGIVWRGDLSKPVPLNNDGSRGRPCGFAATGPAGATITARWPGDPGPRTIPVLALERTVLAFRARGSGAEAISYDKLVSIVRGADWPAWLPEEMAAAMRNVESVALIAGGDGDDRTRSAGRRARTALAQLRSDLGGLPCSEGLDRWPAGLAALHVEQLLALERRVLVFSALGVHEAHGARMTIRQLRQDIAELYSAMDAEDNNAWEPAKARR